MNNLKSKIKSEMVGNRKVDSVEMRRESELRRKGKYSDRGQ